MEEQFKYFAFISYSSHDTAWGKKLQRKLESYRMPATLCSERGWKRKPMLPVFFAPYDIQPGGLTVELQERLKASRHLIVICSPHSARSEWVGKEIAFFHSLGRTEHIHFFIVNGIPHSGDSETECFNPIVNSLGIPEILGANVHEKVFRLPWLNRERAYVQLITKLLGVEFDSLWKRHQRLLRQRIAAWTMGTLAVLAALLGVWVNSMPVDVNVRLQETTLHNDNLPPLQEAVITLKLDNEVKTDTIHSLDEQTVFANIPHRFLDKEVRLTVTCSNWMPIDTTVILNKDMTIPMARDPHAFGDVQFLLWSTTLEKGIANTEVTLAGETTTTDGMGRVKIFIPLEKQCSVYQVKCPIPLENDSLGMPTNESSAMIVK